MRRIITKSDFEKNVIIEEMFTIDPQVNSNISPDNYYEKLVKLIPAEVVTAFITISSLINNTPNPNDYVILYWGVFIFLSICTPLYIYKITSKTLKPRADQLIISTISFVCWCIAYGGPFKFLDWYNDTIGGIILSLWTFTAPLFISNKSS